MIPYRPGRYNYLFKRAVEDILKDSGPIQALELVELVVSKWGIPSEHTVETKRELWAWLKQNANTGSYQMINPNRTFGYTLDDAVSKNDGASSTQPAVNDRTCPSCGNDRCSTTEKSCWKCGNQLT